MSNFKTNFDQTNNTQLQVEIIKLRNIIRYHRDQKGNDRCWLDDELLYESLPETTDKVIVLPSREVFMEKCARFHARRQAPEQTKQVNQEADQLPDQDIEELTEGEQKKEVARLKQAIRLHRNIGDSQRSWQDDQRLYKVLNENTEYDTTLPDQETFLSACDRFFASRGKQSKLHDR
jgi:hypothetical protein